MSGVFVARIYGLQGQERGTLACTIGDALSAKQPEVTYERVIVSYEAWPAEEWEPVTVNEVRVGNWVEVDVVHGEASATVRGPISRITFDKVTIDGCFLFDITHITAIRRRVRQPMPEPVGPAIFAHAGRTFVQRRGDTSLDRWMLLDGPDVDDAGTVWLEWSAVLALDPSTDPVPVDLGGGA